MIVICLTDCPPKVRGDLSKWLMEINTGVYVGNVSARVREELWQRVCQNCKTGRATMVYSSNGEQRMEFRVHNTTWEPVDHEGITLIRRPLPGKAKQPELPKNFSKAAQRQLKKKSSNAKKEQSRDTSYAVIDLETSGLSPDNDEIIEIAALIVENGEVTAEFNRLIKSSLKLSEQIVQLTGITDEERKEQGAALERALHEFQEFVGRRPLVCHNSPFDSAFLRNSLQKCGLSNMGNRYVDTLMLARRKLRHLKNYRLETIASALDINMIQVHRALNDCRITMQVYEKLK